MSWTWMWLERATVTLLRSLGNVPIKREWRLEEPK